MTGPAEILERVIGLSRADDCIAIATASSEANVRWANTTSTTNGVADGSRLYVLSIKDGRVGTESRSHFPAEALEDIVRASEAACEGRPRAEDAMPLVSGTADADWSQPAESLGLEAMAGLSGDLSRVFERARADGSELFGYAERTLSTTWLATSTGVRRRHASVSGTMELTAKTPDFARSAWTGRGSKTFADVDADASYDRLRERLAWSERRIDLEPGRYEVLLEPSAVADLCIYLYWSASARMADEGHSVFAKAGGGTRVGERIARPGITLYSDPAEPGLETTPFAAVAASSPFASVFDNGLDLGRSVWLRDGVLERLITTRHWADRSGTTPAPFVDNLVLPSEGPSLEDMIARTERALLVTCLWYIRAVDPRTLLLTGLTRDGVFLVEDGEVRGAVNNFRFNTSPLDMLANTIEIGRSAPTLAREFGEDFTDTRFPPLRVEAFNMSSVSQAT